MPLDPRIPLQIQHFSVDPMLDAYYDAAENKRRTNAQRLADMAAQQQLELNEAEISEMFRKRKEAEELRKILGEAYGLGPEGEKGQPGNSFITETSTGSGIYQYKGKKPLHGWSQGAPMMKPTPGMPPGFYSFIGPDDMPGGSPAPPRESVDSKIDFGPPVEGNTPQFAGQQSDKATAGQFQERERGAKNFGKLSDWYETGIQAPPEPRPAERATPRESAVLPEPRAEAKPEASKQTRIPGHLSEQQLRKVASINPELATKIRREQQAEVFAAEKATLEQKKGDAELTEKQFAIYQKRLDASREMLVGILNIPEADRPAAYQRALFSMQKMGIDIGQMPTRYNEAFVKEQVAGLASYARTLQEGRQEAAEKRAQGEYDATIGGKRADSEQKQADAEFSKKDPEGLTRSQRLQRDRDVARDKEQREYRQQQLDLQRQRLNRASGGVGTWTPLTDDRGQITGFFNSKTRQIDTNVPEGLRKSGLSEKERAGRVDLEGVVQDLNELERLAKENTGSIGRFSGNVAAGKRWLFGAGAEVNDMFRIADNLADQLLRARSGAAITEGEYRRLRSLAPDPRAPQDKFFSDLKSFRSEVQRKLSGMTGKPVEAKQESSKPKIQILKVE